MSNATIAAPSAPTGASTVARFILPFKQMKLEDLPRVGNKNALLGEMHRALGTKGVRVPDGFAITAEAFRLHLEEAGLDSNIYAELQHLDLQDVAELATTARSIRARIARAPLPSQVAADLRAAYQQLSALYKEEETDVAVRSSATAEDLPTVSFAGQHETFLNVRGVEAVDLAVRRCMASLFTERAIVYRAERGIRHQDVALSVGVQKMVRSDLDSAGVIFTLDTETGFRDVVLITGAWGLGETVVQGRVSPDQFWVHKPTLRQGHRSIIRREIADKAVKLVYADEQGKAVREVRVPHRQRRCAVLSDDDVLTLAQWALMIEDHYSKSAGSPTPMDIEWAKDGKTGELFILEARLKTVHSQRTRPTLPAPAIPLMLNLADPDRAFHLAELPTAGVGLVPIEFVISSWIGVHPMALLHPERIADERVLSELCQRVGVLHSPSELFVSRLAAGVAQIAAAFYPRPVIVRFSDFKTNEYAGLLGGKYFEPAEADPMLGFRGASRYCDELYREGFALECAAIWRVREEMGLTNVKVMIPFCRNLEEGSRVLREMAGNGLIRGQHGLEVHLMCEISNNVILPSEFTDLFDGFSIELLRAPLDERVPEVKRLIQTVIAAAHEKGRPVGICGQALSDDPDFADYLVRIGIDSISVNPEALAQVATRIAAGSEEC